MIGVVGLLALFAAIGIGAWFATQPIRKHVKEHGLPDDVPDL